MNIPNRIRATACMVVGLIGWSSNAAAIEFDFDLLGENFYGVLNNTVTFGAAWRIEERDDFLVGKSALALG